jgi:hypothetical protein
MSNPRYFLGCELLPFDLQPDSLSRDLNYLAGAVCQAPIYSPMPVLGLSSSAFRLQRRLA